MTRLAALDERTRAGFATRYGAQASHVAVSPGRVNLMGDHTDYNDGLVLPMAIDRHTVVAADRDGDQGVVRVGSAAFQDDVRVAANALKQNDAPDWAQYVLGVLHGYREIHGSPGGLRLWIDSDVPVGSGLSSSAALEVATAVAAEGSGDVWLDPIDRALLCQKAEHDFAGVPCGIMDQVACIGAEASSAVFLDCRLLAYRAVPFAGDEVVVLILDSNAPRALAESQYAVRRAQCEAAAGELGVAALRDVSADDVDSRLESLDDVHRRRVRHVVLENARVLSASQAMAASDWSALGATMWESHASLRDDYEVSCVELDTLVEIAQGIGPEGGMLGCRMTGAGFGGCTVSLVRKESAQEIADIIAREYRKRLGIEAHGFVTPAVEGARMLFNSFGL